MQHFQPIIVYYFKKGKNATETHKKICALYGEGIMTDPTNVSKVVCKVLCWAISLDNALLSGRRVEVDSDQIETLFENNQCSTTQEITNILKISISIKLLVKIKIVFLFYGKT